MNQISDISILKNLTNLTYLALWINQISDISTLKSLTKLTDLGLWSNQISDEDKNELKKSLPDCTIYFTKEEFLKDYDEIMTN